MPLIRPSTNIEKLAACRVINASRKLKPIDKLVFGDLTRLDNAEGAFISQTKLAQRLGISRVTVQRTQDQLRHLGLLADEYSHSRKTKSWRTQIPADCMPLSQRDADVCACASLLDSMIPDPVRRQAPEDWRTVNEQTGINADAGPTTSTGINADAGHDGESASTRMPVGSSDRHQRGAPPLLNAEHPPAQCGAQSASALSTHRHPHGAAISVCTEAVEPDIQAEAPVGADSEAEGRVQTRTRETDEQLSPRNGDKPPLGFDWHPNLPRQLVRQNDGQVLTAGETFLELTKQGAA